MRRLAGLIVVPLLLLSTAACGDDKGSNSPSASAKPVITAGKEFGKKPNLSKGEGEPPKELVVDVLSPGKGAGLKEGQAVEVNYLGQTWDGDKPFDNSFDRGEPFQLTLGAGGVIKGWDQGLKGQKVGSRVQMSIPPELGYGAQGQGEIPPNATLVFVIDILKGTTVPTAADGKKVAQDDAGLPKVGTNTDGNAPSLEVPKTAEPKKLVSNYVLEGDGAVVKETDSVVVQYEALLWKDGKKFDSTYTQGKPATFQLGQGGFEGLTKGLAGKKTGSRVLLVIPPSLAFGDKEQNGIPANSTLVFSMDVLGVL